MAPSPSLGSVRQAANSWAWLPAIGPGRRADRAATGRLAHIYSGNRRAAPVRDHGRRTGGCPSNGRTFIYAIGVNCTTEVVQARSELGLAGGLARQLVRQDPYAVGLGQGAGLPVQDLPGG